MVLKVQFGFRWAPNLLCCDSDFSNSELARVPHLSPTGQYETIHLFNLGPGTGIERNCSV
jgi:hypothetical protein